MAGIPKVQVCSSSLFLINLFFEGDTRQPFPRVYYNERVKEMQQQPTFKGEEERKGQVVSEKRDLLPPFTCLLTAPAARALKARWLPSSPPLVC